MAEYEYMTGDPGSDVVYDHSMVNDPENNPEYGNSVNSPPDWATVVIAPVGVIVTRNGDNGVIAVSMTSPGAWMVTADPGVEDWLTYAPTTRQTEDGTVTWNVAKNYGDPRVANLYVNEEAFKVDQDGKLLRTAA